MSPEARATDCLHPAQGEFQQQYVPVDLHQRICDHIQIAVILERQAIADQLETAILLHGHPHVQEALRIEADAIRRRGKSS